MSRKQKSLPLKSVWAYGYEISPPQDEQRLRTIKKLLADEHTDARRGDRTWRGKVVLEEKVTHILVVSDSAEDRDINRKLEAELKTLQVGFSRTASLAVKDVDTAWTNANASRLGRNRTG